MCTAELPLASCCGIIFQSTLTCSALTAACVSCTCGKCTALYRLTSCCGVIFQSASNCSALTAVNGRSAECRKCTATVPPHLLLRRDLPVRLELLRADRGLR